MATDYTHLNKTSLEGALAFGAPGSEVDVISSAGAISASSATVTTQSTTNATVTTKLMLSRTVNTSSGTIAALATTTPFLRFSGHTIAIALTGIVSGTDGQRLVCVFSGTGAVTVTNESTTVSAARRITTATGGNVATTAAGRAEFIYDGGTSRWINLYVTA